MSLSKGIRCKPILAKDRTKGGPKDNNQHRFSDLKNISLNYSLYLLL